MTGIWAHGPQQVEEGNRQRAVRLQELEARLAMATDADEKAKLQAELEALRDEYIPDGGPGSLYIDAG